MGGFGEVGGVEYYVVLAVGSQFFACTDDVGNALQEVVVKRVDIGGVVGVATKGVEIRKGIVGGGVLRTVEGSKRIDGKRTVFI